MLRLFTWWEWVLMVCASLGAGYCFYPLAARTWYRHRWRRAAKSAYGAVVPQWIQRERYSREGDKVA